MQQKESEIASIDFNGGCKNSMENHICCIKYRFIKILVHSFDTNNLRISYQYFTLEKSFMKILKCHFKISCPYSICCVAKSIKRITMIAVMWKMILQIDFKIGTNFENTQLRLVLYLLKS